MNTIESNICSSPLKISLINSVGKGKYRLVLTNIILLLKICLLSLSLSTNHS